MNELEIEYEQHVRECVRAALTSGASDLNEVLQEAQGADPILVAKRIDEEHAQATVVRVGGSFTTQDDNNVFRKGLATYIAALLFCHNRRVCACRLHCRTEWSRSSDFFCCSSFRRGL